MDNVGWLMDNVVGDSPVVGVPDWTWRPVRITSVNEVVVVDLEHVLGVSLWVAQCVLLGGENLTRVLANESLLFQRCRGEDAEALHCTRVAYLDQAALQGVLEGQPLIGLRSLPPRLALVPAFPSGSLWVWGV